jgi:hypothetical protein
MPHDTARSVQLRRQIAEEMKDALGIDQPVANVQSALDNSLDMHHAEIVETVADECCDKQQGPHHHHSGD